MQVCIRIPSQKHKLKPEMKTTKCLITDSLIPLPPKKTVLHWTICWLLFLLRFSVDVHKWVFRPKITLLTRGGKKNKQTQHQGHLPLSKKFTDRTIGMIFSSWFKLILCSVGFQHQYSGLLWNNDQKMNTSDRIRFSPSHLSADLESWWKMLCC